MSKATKKWYAVYTKPGYEKKVANLLSRRQIENYCPLKRNLSGKNRILLEPLFESYVFAHIAETEMRNIRMIDHVVNFVYWLGKPAEIQDDEITILKRFMIEYGDVKMEKIPFNTDGIVRVIGGSFDGNKAQIISYKNNTVKIVLASLGYILFAEAEKSNVEIITSAKKRFPLLERYQYAIEKYTMNSASKF